MKKTVAVLFFISFCLCLRAQNILSIVDAETKRGVENVVVDLIFLQNDVSQHQISGESGDVQINQQLPAIISINHINYQKFVDTLYNLDQPVLLFPRENYLREVVVTGQFSPQSARNSVYQVRSIGQERIEAQGATNLQTVLQNELNLRFNRDNALGTSGMNLQGISGQNVKVLIDGIPVVGRSGVANEIDLNQLNINSIEKIEIVEGPMSVIYGADALAGVINIITKKDGENKLDLNLTLHEESVGDEYSYWSEGIHIPNLQAGYRVNDQWYARIEGGVNYFGGWQGNRVGRDKQWHPKMQKLAAGLLKYEIDDFNIFYRGDYLHEVITDFGPVVENNLRDPFALDEEFISQRWMHQLQAEIKVNQQASINSALSYTDYQRNSRPYSKNIVTNQEQEIVKELDTVFYRSFFMRHTFLQRLGRQQLQVGTDGTFETAGGTTLSPGQKYLHDIGVFASAEFKAGNLKVRPGLRYTFNSVFTTIPTPSINLKYDFSDKISLRAGYGRGFRAPSIRELYHEFIDTNHNLVGNPDLEPEYSHNFNSDLTYQVLKNWELNFGGFYNDIQNRITILIPENTNAAWSYFNLNEFKTTGITLRSDWRNDQNFSMQTGFAYTGRFQMLSQEHQQIPRYVFSPEINQNITYKIPKLNLNLAAFYKFTGAFQDYRLVENQPKLQQIDAFHWLDLTLSRSIGKHLDASLGVRNLLDITMVNNNITGGAHSGSENGATSVGYGRSFFARINYKLNLK